MGLALFAQITVQLKDSGTNQAQGVADVLLGALGVTGVMVLIAILAGLAMAGVLFAWRSRKPLDH